MKNILAIDFEEWYHPEYLKNENVIKKSRINKQYTILNDILKKYDINASFFLVGRVAYENKELIQKINKDGHEIGYHGNNHNQLKNILWQKEFSRLRDKLDD